MLSVRQIFAATVARRSRSTCRLIHALEGKVAELTPFYGPVRLSGGGRRARFLAGRADQRATRKSGALRETSIERTIILSALALGVRGLSATASLMANVIACAGFAVWPPRGAGRMRLPIPVSRILEHGDPRAS